MSVKKPEPIVYNPPMFADSPGKIMHVDPAPAVAADTTGSVLSEALALVYGARSDAYGHPADDYQRTGVIWGALLRNWARENSQALEYGPVEVPADLACLMMIAVKLSREVNRHGRDNLVDIAGYAACIERIVKQRDGQE